MYSFCLSPSWSWKKLFAIWSKRVLAANILNNCEWSASRWPPNNLCWNNIYILHEHYYHNRSQNMLNRSLTNKNPSIANELVTTCAFLYSSKLSRVAHTPSIFQFEFAFWAHGRLILLDLRKNTNKFCFWIFSDVFETKCKERPNH